MATFSQDYSPFSQSFATFRQLFATLSDFFFTRFCALTHLGVHLVTDLLSLL